MGVATYWVVDPDARVVEVWRPADERTEIVTETLTWRVADAAAAAEIELAFAAMAQFCRARWRSLWWRRGRLLALAGFAAPRF